MRHLSTLSLAAALTFTVSASAQMTTYSTYGSAAALGDGCVELTTGPASNAGAVWAEERLDLTQPFHIQASLNFGSIPHGAEGMVWALHTEGTEVDGYGALDRAFGVEFDTRAQTELGDIDADHIAMINHGSYVHTDGPDSFTAGPVAAFVDGGDLEDGEDHLVDIVWDPAGPEMRVYLDCEERLVASIDLMEDIFDGERFATWGFTAETADAFNVGRVCLTENATGTDTEIYACPESAVQLVAGGLDVTEYTWAPGNVVSDATLQAPFYTGVTSNTLTVTYTNQCGVSITEEVHVIVEEVNVTLASEGQALTCANGGVLSCQAVSDFAEYVDYTWTVNNVEVGQGMTFDMDAPGTLGLEVTYPGTSSLLCADNFSMTVLVDTMRFDVEAGLPGTITCANPAPELLGATTNDPAAAIAWTTEDGAFEGATDVATAYATAAGTYVMTVTNLNNGCTASDEVVMMEDTELPEVTLGYLDGTLDCVVREVAMNGTDIFPQEYTPLVSWMHAETGEVVSSDVDPVFTTAGVYTMVVEFLENGCTTSVKQAADVQSSVDVLDLSDMVLPNVITPDNNGNNDRFMPFVPGHEDTNVLTMMDTYQIQVYNRWGDVLFQNNGMPLQWDGRANGQVVDPGSYIVSVSYEATCGGVQKGDLQTTLEVIY